MKCSNCGSTLSTSASLCSVCGWIADDSVQRAELTEFYYETPRQDKGTIKKSIGIVLALAAIIVGVIVPLIEFPEYFDTERKGEIIAVIGTNAICAVFGIILATISVEQSKKGGGKGGIGHFARVICVLWILVGPGIFKIMHLYM